LTSADKYYVLQPMPNPLSSYVNLATNTSHLEISVASGKLCY